MSSDSRLSLGFQVPLLTFHLPSPAHTSPIPLFPLSLRGCCSLTDPHAVWRPPPGVCLTPAEVVSMRFMLPVQGALVWAGVWGRGADAEAHQGAKGAMTKGGAEGSGPLTPPHPGGAWPGVG